MFVLSLSRRNPLLYIVALVTVYLTYIHLCNPIKPPADIDSDTGGYVTESRRNGSWCSSYLCPNGSSADEFNATIIALVRNEELNGIIQSMQSLERSWNSKFHYPWTFFNDVPFTDEFKRQTQAQTSARCNYELIPSEHWDTPTWVNLTRFAESAAEMRSHSVKYAEKISYHQMCRWYAGFFYKHPALEDFRYYWRVEPNVRFFCDIDYDVFRYMYNEGKTYGFTLQVYDFPHSLRTLWEETLSFTATHPEQVNRNNAMRWLIGNQRPQNNAEAGGYSTCHFWSNFEIGDLKFWRSQVYDAYFEHLDQSGGFFYERWGDAPVHSIGIGLFEDIENVHWFRDIGYNHHPYYNCPASPKCKGCQPGVFTYVPWLTREDCIETWFKAVGASPSRFAIRS